MADSLIEAFKNAKNRHSSGGVSLVCLDDEDLPESEYGTLGQRTIVPRANKEGGIMGLARDNDCKYGKGVTRREVNMTENGFVVEEETKNYRPDTKDEVEEPLEDPMAVLQDAILSTQVPTAGPPELPDPYTMAGNQPSETMQMMRLMMTMIQGQNGNGNGNGNAAKAVPVTPPPAPVKKKPAKSVTFGGDFGKFTAPYSSARVEEGFILLAVDSEQPSSYEPPISPVNPLKLTVDGSTYQVLNVGLSFEYKGDIVTIMPLKAETTDDT